jgi:hypothetical protein
MPGASCARVPPTHIAALGRPRPRQEPSILFQGSGGSMRTEVKNIFSFQGNMVVNRLI